MVIRERYNIPKEAKILLYVGNISRNKNQEQMIRVYDILPESLREELFILFIGRNLTSDYSICDMVSNSRNPNHLIICGNIDKIYMPEYYTAADGVVLLSISEGFGLSLIEGMHFGKPSVTFTDLDAFEDIYNECAVIGIENRTDEAVAEGIKTLINKAWDKDLIKKYSQKFDSQHMAKNYEDTFKQLIA